MYLTIHGVERLQERTQMTVKEVLELVKECSINLGSSERGNKEYLLFYSPIDRQCKVAVVSESDDALVSVLNDHYHLPEGVQRVTTPRREKARQLYWDYFYRLHPPPPPQERLLSLSSLEPLLIKIEVRVRERKEYEYTVEGEGVVTDSVDDLWPALVSAFREITPIVEEYKKTIPTRVKYWIYMFRRGGKWPSRTFPLRHETVMRRLRAA